MLPALSHAREPVWLPNPHAHSSRLRWRVPSPGLVRSYLPILARRDPAVRTVLWPVRRPGPPLVGRGCLRPEGAGRLAHEFRRFQRGSCRQELARRGGWSPVEFSLDDPKNGVSVLGVGTSGSQFNHRGQGGNSATCGRNKTCSSRLLMPGGSSRRWIDSFSLTGGTEGAQRGHRHGGGLRSP